MKRFNSPDFASLGIRPRSSGDRDCGRRRVVVPVADHRRLSAEDQVCLFLFRRNGKRVRSLLRARLIVVLFAAATIATVASLSDPSSAMASGEIALNSFPTASPTPRASCPAGIFGDQHVTIKGGEISRQSVVQRDTISITVVAQNRASEATVAIKAVIRGPDGNFVDEEVWRNVRIAGGNIVFQAEKSLSFTWTAPDSLGEYTINAAVKSNDDIDTHCHGKEDIANFDVVRNSYWPTVVQNSLNPETLYFLLEKDHSDEPKTQIFRARGSDRDGNLSKAEWTVNDNLRKVVNYDPSRSSEDTVFSFPFNQPGEYEVSVVFEDTKGRRSYASNAKWTVTVGSPPTPTVDSLECSPTPATLGQETECSATFRDAQPTRIHWTAVDGTPGAYSPIGNKEFKTKWTSIGQRTNVLREISVYGCNDNGCGATWSRSVRVVNYAPRASTDSISPEPSSSNLLKANQRYTFTARATDSDNNLVSYQWHIDGSPVTPQPVAFREADSKTESFSRSFQAGATHMVEATFTDSNGNSDSVKWSFTVNNPPTVTLARSEAQSSPIHVDTPEAFSIEGEDIDGNLEKWIWEVDRVGVPWGGHASPELGEPFSTTFSHSFPSSGFYDVTATLTDAEEASDSATLRVEVEDAPELPDLTVQITEQITPVVGKGMSIPLRLTNKGGEASGPFNVNIYFSDIAEETDEDSDAGALIPAGMSHVVATLRETGMVENLAANESLEGEQQGFSVPNSLNPGVKWVCAQVEYLNPEIDSDESNNANCIMVYVLPDMGDDFPGQLLAFPHLDDKIQHDLGVNIELSSTALVAVATAVNPALGTLALGTVVQPEVSGSFGSEAFWVFVPTVYTEGETNKLAKEIVERTWGGLEHRADRKDRYKKLALGIARRGQTYGDHLFFTPLDQKEALDSVVEAAEKKLLPTRLNSLTSREN